MISSLDAASQSFLTGVDQIQQQLDTAQTQLTTGLKINAVSDAPDQIANLWQTRSDLDQVDQINSNLGRVQTEVNTGRKRSRKCGHAGRERARPWAPKAPPTRLAPTRDRIWPTSSAPSFSSWYPPPTRQWRAATSSRAIAISKRPYSIDLTQTNPISAYQGSASTRQIQVADGSSFSVALTAQQIFDSSNAQQNVFQSINNLRQALAEQ